MPAPPSSAIADTRVDLRVDDAARVVVLRGDWTLEGDPPHPEALLASADGPPHGAPVLAFDTSALGAWDTTLLVFVVRCEDFARTHALRFDDTALPARLVRLLALARAVPERTQQAPAPPAQRLARLGAAALRFRDDFLAAVTFAGDVALALGRLVGRRVRMRWRDFWVVVQDNSSGALPIVTLIALLVGIIIAFLGVVVLERFGADYYVSYLVGFGMLRELGALMTGIILAGRTGAAFAAELGSMKITEEVDALTTLGIAPIEHLVLPRLLGLFVMMPLLTVYADFIGIAGGMAVSVVLLELSLKQFVNGLLAAVTLPDALLGVFKGTIFGFIVGVAGCMKGLQTGSDAGAVGRAATAAVVLGITLIILANAIVDWLAALLEI